MEERQEGQKETGIMTGRGEGREKEQGGTREAQEGRAGKKVKGEERMKGGLTGIKDTIEREVIKVGGKKRVLGKEDIKDGEMEEEWKEGNKIMKRQYNTSRSRGISMGTFFIIFKAKAEKHLG